MKKSIILVKEYDYAKVIISEISLGRFKYFDCEIVIDKKIPIKSEIIKKLKYDLLQQNILFNQIGENTFKWRVKPLRRKQKKFSIPELKNISETIAELLIYLVRVDCTVFTKIKNFTKRS